MAGKRKKAGGDRKAPAGAPSDRLQLAWIAAKALVALGIVAAVVAGVALLGRRAGEQVAGRDRYAVKVSDIACDPPPGRDRVTFLAEVRYLANLPETVQAVDPKLKETLAAAFARHPWVVGVTGVDVTPDATIRVGLRFRTPVLAVRVAGDPEPRLVDATGVLLPPGADPAGLPVLTPAVAPPKTPAGDVWADPTVTRAAELADLHKPVQVEKSSKGWRLTKPDGKVLVVSW